MNTNQLKKQTMTERELLQQLEEVKLQISNKDFWNQDTTELRKKQIEICKALVELHPRKNEPYLREAWFSYYQFMDEKNQKKT